MLYTPEMSRRARAVELWATLADIQRSGECWCGGAIWGADRLSGSACAPGRPRRRISTVWWPPS